MSQSVLWTTDPVANVVLCATFNQMCNVYTNIGWQDYKKMFSGCLTNCVKTNNCYFSGNYKHRVKVILSLLSEKKKDLLVFDRSPENSENTSAITPRQLKSIKQGIHAGLAHGPILNSQVQWLGSGNNLHHKALWGNNEVSLAVRVMLCLGEGGKFWWKRLSMTGLAPWIGSEKVTAIWQNM